MTTIEEVLGQLSSLLRDLSIGATSEAINLFCAPTGDDSNPGTEELPLREPQTALDRVPSEIRHLVKIKCAPGEYKGFNVARFRFNPLNDDTPCGLHVFGTMQTATLASGNATGTLDSITDATIGTASYVVIGDSTNALTADDAREKLVEITSGTGVGRVFPISTNSATGLTVPASSAAAVAAVGSGYAIKECASVIKTPMLLPGSVAGANGNPVAGAAQKVGIAVTSPIGQVRSTYIRIEQFKVDLTGADSVSADVLVQNAQGLVRIERMQCVSAAGTPLKVMGAGQTSFNFSVLSRPVVSAMVSTSGGVTSASGNLSMSACYIRGLGNGCLGFQVGGSMSHLFLANVQCDTDCLMDVNGPCWIQMSGIIKKTYTSNHNFGLRTRMASGPTSPGGVYLHLLPGAALEISNCAASSAVWISGFSVFLFEGTLLGTNSLTAITAELGAKVRVSAGSTITGTTEIMLDGVGWTLAQMRSQSPKLVATGGYGTVVFE